MYEFGPVCYREPVEADGAVEQDGLSDAGTALVRQDGGRRGFLSVYSQLIVLCVQVKAGFIGLLAMLYAKLTIMTDTQHPNPTTHPPSGESLV